MVTSRFFDAWHVFIDQKLFLSAISRVCDFIVDSQVRRHRSSGWAVADAAIGLVREWGGEWLEAAVFN